MFRSFIAVVTISVVGQAALAEDASASTAAVYACVGLKDDAERLACYDSAVGRLKQAEEAGEVTTVSREDIEEVRRESFGFSLPSLPRLALPSLGGDEEKLNRITVAVDRVRADAFGKAIVTLENGQVWRQIDDTRVLEIRRGAEMAEIRRASLGSFKMKLDDGRSFRAKREQ